ncbi:intermediate conductance calcium-activated potassium channel protein 4 isoform X2 [Rhinichthys klamathensis goyatoka]|uniref:intermediate conductance calcium-activated potassium channel protein 4 isoform X2 n=1 Tax=Rhinichthys klamathensis goyatoka TaxID=3034132 RepID=UPI0024B5AE1E|nr:intermediate conductance calcium-activated potassium channel protein 4 isoform X2 [Rhinichthys klamathensis goyatoka]
MEMTARLAHLDTKVDGRNCDGLVNHNGETTEIRVPLSHTGKRLSPIEGGNLYRLRDRKFLLEDKKRLCAWALGTALLGILLMVLHAELCPVVYQPGSIYALSINGLISFSTGCLLILIIAFHYKDIRLFIIDHNQVDWRIAMTSNRVLGISLELIVCAIHPVAIYLRPDMGGRLGGKPEQNSSTPLCLSSSHKEVMLDVELLLSALMFLRLYLVHRAVLLHSKVLLSASYRSIGSLNNINFSFRFVLKVLMNKYPARTLLVFIMFFWLSAAWMLRLCERQKQVETGGMDTALWLIAITFLTVGYGDVSPHTSCGKLVCLFTGVMIRHAAADVLRECWLLHRTTQTKDNSGEHRHHQRCLLEAIRVFRHLRLKQRKIRDYASEMVDLSKMQMIMCDLSANWNSSYHELEQRIISMEQKLDELGRSFQSTSELLTQALHRRRLDHR